jgi:hypothetical protein
MARTGFTHDTEQLVRKALELHRLATATDQTTALQSPASVTRPDDGISRPTEDAALCPRRQHVTSEVRALSTQLADMIARLEHALDVWSGHGRP